MERLTVIWNDRRTRKVPNRLLERRVDAMRRFFFTRDTKGENMFQGVTTAICGFVVGFIVATCVIEFATDAAVREIVDQVATRTQEINRERIVDEICHDVLTR